MASILCGTEAGTGLCGDMSSSIIVFLNTYYLTRRDAYVMLFMMFVDYCFRRHKKNTKYNELLST
jgi:hypothetical protein